MFSGQSGQAAGRVFAFLVRLFYVMCFFHNGEIVVQPGARSFFARSARSPRLEGILQDSNQDKAPTF